MKITPELIEAASLKISHRDLLQTCRLSDFATDYIIAHQHDDYRIDDHFLAHHDSLDRKSVREQWTQFWFMDDAINVRVYSDRVVMFVGSTIEIKSPTIGQLNGLLSILGGEE